MKKYIIRSFIVTILFINILIGGFSVMSVYSENRITGIKFPPSSVFWTAFFVLLILLLILHKKDKIQKALFNLFFLVSIGTIIMLFPVIFSFNPSKLYILLSFIFLTYLCSTHEGYNLLDFFIKTLSYTTEIFKYKIKSSFAKYLIFELVSYVFIVLILHKFMI